MDIIYKKVGEVIPYEKNPRKNDQAVKFVAESIKQFGFKVPIIIDKDNVIVADHTRLKAALELGMKEVPCIVADDLTEEQVKAFRLADNRVGEIATWDFDLLDDQLAELSKEFDLVALGFEDLLPEEEVEEPHDDDFDVDEFLTEETISKRGDIFKLGRHTLLCGDSTQKEDLAKLLESQKIAAVFTDPPWNVDYGGHSHPSWKKRTIENDNMSSEDFNLFLTKAFDGAKEFLKPGAMFYCVMSPQEWGNIMDVLETQQYHWSSTIIWAKDSLVLSRKDYHTQYEPIWYGWYAGKDNSPRLCPLEDRTQSDLWEIPRPKVSELHPTMKPIELVARAFKNSSKEGDDVLDLFGGSGTSIIAAEQTNRSCYMMELTPKYTDVIVKRYIRYMGSAKDCYMNGEPLPEEFTEGILD